jgi:tetratricopeptide (TPR) repeat protein
MLWALYNRSSAWEKKSEYGKAVDDLNELLRQDPKHETALWRRALLLAASPDSKVRDGNAAVADAIRLCVLTQWKQPTSLDVLAAAYAELGDFDKAVAWQTKAVNLTTDKDTKSRFQAYLNLYKQRKPYRLKPLENAIVPVEASEPAAARHRRR